jgi:hypothetical protein
MEIMENTTEDLRKEARRMWKPLTIRIEGIEGPEHMTKTDKDNTQIVSRLLTVLYFLNKVSETCAM